MLLIAGGTEDPNLVALAAAANELGVPWCDARHAPGASPAFSWDLLGSSARLSGRELQARGAFIRYDVFAGFRDARPQVASRALGWYQTFAAWMALHPQVRVFNRRAREASKPMQLVLASQAGLRVPRTVISNETEVLASWQLEGAIAKPVAGGDFCYALEDLAPALTKQGDPAPMPAIVQQRLVAPEIRIYVVGDQTLAFDMDSPSLDYRRHQDVAVRQRECPSGEAEALRRLMGELEMDFGAADFKTDPASGDLMFLELNSSPMFARFDQSAGGALARAMVRHLTAESGR